MVQRAQRRKYHYIYKVTRFDGKYYYGMHSTDNLDDGYKGSGTRLWHSYRKHGIEKHTFEIQEHWFSREDLKAREKEIVNEELLKDPLCMNIVKGGHGGWSSRAGIKGRSNRSKECLDKVKCAALKGSENFRIKLQNDVVFRKNYLQKRSLISKQTWNDNEYRQRMLNVHLGSKRNDDTKQKMSASKMGSSNNRFGTCWVMKDGKSVSIKKELLEQYLNDGYVKGRKIKK